ADLDHRPATEYVCTGEQPIPDRAEGVEIGAAVDGVGVGHRLGCQIEGRPGDRIRHRQRSFARGRSVAAHSWSDVFDQPEVDDLDEVRNATTVDDDDVGRLDVAM